MKKILAAAMAGVMVLSLCACGAPTETPTETPTDTGSAVTGVANPWTDCSSLAEAEELFGFSFALPEALYDGMYTADSFRAMKEEMLEIAYHTEGGACIEIRQAPGEDQDISGDYTEFSHSFEDEICGVAVQIRGTKDKICVVTFSYSGDSFAVTADEGIGYDVLESILSDLTGAEVSGENDEPDEPTEGAPVVEEDRFIADEPISDLDIAGEYSGIAYDICTVEIYTDIAPDTVYVGTIEIVDGRGVTMYAGKLKKLMDNYYEIEDTDATITVYTDNGNIGLELYTDGEHADYFVMTEPYIS